MANSPCNSVPAKPFRFLRTNSTKLGAFLGLLRDCSSCAYPPAQSQASRSVAAHHIDDLPVKRFASSIVSTNLVCRRDEHLHVWLPKKHTQPSQRVDCRLIHRTTAQHESGFRNCAYISPGCRLSPQLDQVHIRVDEVFVGS
jgi:hypothetical protein